MLTVLDRDANIVELVSSPSTNHVEGTTADSITQSNIKDILPEDAYKNIRKNMEQVFRSGKSAIARHDLMMDGVPHHYEHWLSLLDKEYLLCMCRMFRNFGKQNRPMPNNKMKLCGLIH